MDPREINYETDRSSPLPTPERQNRQTRHSTWRSPSPDPEHYRRSGSSRHKSSRSSARRRRDSGSPKMDREHYRSSRSSRHRRSRSSSRRRESGSSRRDREYHRNSGSSRHRRSRSSSRHRESGSSRRDPDHHRSSGSSRHRSSRSSRRRRDSRSPKMDREHFRRSRSSSHQSPRPSLPEPEIFPILESLALKVLIGDLEANFEKWLSEQVRHDKGKRFPTEIEKLPEDIRSLYDNFLEKVEKIEEKLAKNKKGRYLEGNQISDNDGSLMNLLHKIRIIGSIFLNYSFRENLSFIWRYLLIASKDKSHVENIKSDQELIQDYKKKLGIEESKTTAIPKKILNKLKAKGLITES